MNEWTDSRMNECARPNTIIIIIAIIITVINITVSSEIAYSAMVQLIGCFATTAIVSDRAVSSDRAVVFRYVGPVLLQRFTDQTIALLPPPSAPAEWCSTAQTISDARIQSASSTLLVVPNTTPQLVECGLCVHARGDAMMATSTAFIINS